MGEIPVGYRFIPKDEEVIKYYLLNKVDRRPLPWDGIGELDFYGSQTPWEICEQSKTKSVYAFTKLKKASKSRFSRVTDFGWEWHGNNKGKEIFDSETHNLIGRVKALTFRPKVNKEKDKQGSSSTAAKNIIAAPGGGNWIMHEYSLEGQSLKGREVCDYVLCHVHLKKSKSSKRKHDEEDEEEEVEAHFVLEDCDWIADCPLVNEVL